MHNKCEIENVIFGSHRKHRSRFNEPLNLFDIIHDDDDDNSHNNFSIGNKTLIAAGIIPLVYYFNVIGNLRKLTAAANSKQSFCVFITANELV